jgi:hypothetical protein
MDRQHREMNMQHGHSTWTSRVDRQHRHAWAWRMDVHDLTHSIEIWSYSIDPGHAALTWTFSTSVDTKHLKIKCKKNFGWFFKINLKERFFMVSIGSSECTWFDSSKSIMQTLMFFYKMKFCQISWNFCQIFRNTKFRILGKFMRNFAFQNFAGHPYYQLQ